jgi:hypothetical protein
MKQASASNQKRRITILNKEGFELKSMDIVKNQEMATSVAFH